MSAAQAVRRLAIASAMLAGGCASDGSIGGVSGPGGDGGSVAADGAGAATREIAPGLVVVSSAPASGTLALGDLLLPAGARSTWTVLSARGEEFGTGDTIEFVASSSSKHGAEYEVAEGPDQTLYLVGVDEQRPAMVASLSKRDEAVSRFEPALAMGVPQLGAGESVEGNSEMVVLSSKALMKQRDKGTAARRLAYTRDETIRTASGERACRRVEVDFKAELGMAKATVHSVRWVEPGVGPIAEERREKIVVLGLVPTERRRVIVRALPGGSGGADGRAGGSLP